MTLKGYNDIEPIIIFLSLKNEERMFAFLNRLNHCALSVRQITMRVSIVLPTFIA